MLLASTGLRATEEPFIRIKDLNLVSNSFAKLTIKWEYTKTRDWKLSFNIKLFF